MPRAVTRILPGLPGEGPTPVQFSAPGKGTHSEGFVVEFSLADGETWVGNFQGGFGAYQGVLAHPNGVHVVVVASGQAYVVDPDSRTSVEEFGVNLTDVSEVPELDLLVFTNGLWFEAFGSQGHAWKSRRISWDGVRELKRSGLTLEGEAYSPLDDGWHSFVLDLRSGDVSGGSFDESQFRAI